MSKVFDLLTAEEVVKLDFIPWVNTQTIVRKAQRNELPAYKLGKRWYFKKEQLLQTLMAAGSNAAALKLQQERVRELWREIGADLQRQGYAARDVPDWINDLRKSQ